MEDLLRRICRIDDGRLLGLIIADEVGIVVASPGPWHETSASLLGYWEDLHTHWNRVDMHVARFDE